MRFLRLLPALLLVGCATPEDRPPVLRLVDLFEPTQVRGSAAHLEASPPEEWAFTDDDDGWSAPLGVSNLRVEEGRLRGRTTSETPTLFVQRSPREGDSEPVHAVEIRLRVSAGANLAFFPAADEEQLLERARGALSITTPLVPGDEVRTYTVSPRSTLTSSDVRYLALRPTDTGGAEFEIESVRFILRRHHLASLPSGVSWQGAGEVYREALVARTPETIAMPVDLPPTPRLELSFATVDPRPVTFEVSLAESGDAEDRPLLARTVTTPDRWEHVSYDLGAYAGRRVTLHLSLEGEEAGTVGLWGAPVIHDLGAAPSPEVATGEAPSRVILFVADTLRADHLDAYGYERITAPTITRLAAEGVLFRNVVSQATWTKVSTPSFLTSLYPTSNGVLDFTDRLPAAAVTLAERLREAGYRTASFVTNGFVGQFTNLHQGYETLHEPSSFDYQQPSKSARAVVDRFLPWLERHREAPFFAYLHVVDPHSPFEPYPPYATRWFDPADREEHDRHREAVREHIQDPLGQRTGMPTRSELQAAGIDPATFVQREIDWYDGSIRALDVELRRIVERLESLDLLDGTLLVFLSDHGEEFLEHDMHFHGQSVYGELADVPLVLSWPGGLEAGVVVEETVQSLDLLPTLLQLLALEPHDGMQGQSLVPLFAPDRAAGERFRPRPAVTEKVQTENPLSPALRDLEARAIVSDGWKLIKNRGELGGRPELELFDRRNDPLDQHNLAEEHPEIVERLMKQLEGWQKMAEAGRVQSDADSAAGMSPEELERLRSLGYVQ